MTLGKLPSATGKAYTLTNVRKGFMLNGQIDIDSKLAPCMTNIVHTYRGDVEGTCLKDPKWLIEKFYPEMFENALIVESTFNSYQIPKDCDFEGVSIDKDFTVSQENRQRAKVLSSKKQIMERRKLIHSKKMALYNKEKSKYNAETKEYQLNNQCEQKILKIFNECMTSAAPSDPTVVPADNSSNKVRNTVNVPMSYTSFQSVRDLVTPDMILCNKKSILSAEAKAFVRVRSEVELVRGRLAYKNVPNRKDTLLDKLVAMVTCTVNERYYSIEPVAPAMVTNVLDVSVDEEDNLSNTDDEMISL